MDRYTDRSNADYENGKYAVLDSMCFAEFLRYYSVAKTNHNLDNDCQSEELTNKVIEENHDHHVSYPKLVPLMSSNEKLLCRKVPGVLQYHVPNINTDPDDYYHHMLVLLCPFRREQDPICGSPPSKILQLKRSTDSEPYADLIHGAFQRNNDDTQSNIDPFRQQENSEVEPELQVEVEPEFQDKNSNQDLVEINCTTLSFNYSGNIVHQDYETNRAIRSLNTEQQEVVDGVHKWSRDYIKQRPSEQLKEVIPF